MKKNRFKREKGWVDPPIYHSWMKMLASDTPGDRDIAKQLFRSKNIKASKAMISRAIQKFGK